MMAKKPVQLSEDELDCFQEAGRTQVELIVEQLTNEGINFSVDDIAIRVAIALHSSAIRTRIVEQLRNDEKKLADMSLQEKFDAAGWVNDRPEAKPGDRERSRAVIESLSSGSNNAKSLQGKMLAAQKRVPRRIQTTNPAKEL